MTEQSTPSAEAAQQQAQARRRKLEELRSVLLTLHEDDEARRDEALATIAAMDRRLESLQKRLQDIETELNDGPACQEESLP